MITNIFCDKIETLKVSNLPDYAIGWSPKESIEMMDRILSKVKQEVTIDGPNHVLMITIKSTTDISYDPMTAADHEQFPIMVVQLWWKNWIR